MTLPVPAVPGLTLVFTITADIAAPLDAGPGLGGRRLHIPITGGRVDGPRLTGEVLPGGSDWALIRDDGLTEVRASYTIRATDGTPVWVQNRGLRRSTPDVLARLRSGAPVDPADYWFRATPRFDAPDGPHAWLRQSVFVASLAPAGRTIVIAVFDVT